MLRHTARSLASAKVFRQATKKGYCSQHFENVRPYRLVTAADKRTAAARKATVGAEHVLISCTSVVGICKSQPSLSASRMYQARRLVHSQPTEHTPDIYIVTFQEDTQESLDRLQEEIERCNATASTRKVQLLICCVSVTQVMISSDFIYLTLILLQDGPGPYDYSEGFIKNEPDGGEPCWSHQSLSENVVVTVPYAFFGDPDIYDVLESLQLEGVIEYSRTTELIAGPSLGEDDEGDDDKREE